MTRFLICFFVACTTTATTPDPTPVAAPVVACSPPVDAGASCDAADDACDAAPPTYYQDTCLVPPSVCADSHWAAYFDDGICVNGRCELATKYHYCETGCQGGACIRYGGTNPGRGF